MADKDTHFLVGEKSFWSRITKKGWIRKKKVALTEITNLRVLVYSFETDQILSEIYLSPDLKVNTLNVHRDSHGYSSGIYVRESAGMGMYGGPRTSSSHSEGDILIFNEDKSLVLHHLEDPESLVSLIKNLVKERMKT